MNGVADRLSRQMAFIEELEKLKLVDRRNRRPGSPPPSMPCNRSPIIEESADRGLYVK